MVSIAVMDDLRSTADQIRVGEDLADPATARIRVAVMRRRRARPDRPPAGAISLTASMSPAGSGAT